MNEEAKAIRGFETKDSTALLEEAFDLETGTYLDVQEAYLLAREGQGEMSHEIRLKVYMLALGVVRVDKSDEMFFQLCQENIYKDLVASGKLLHNEGTPVRQSRAKALNETLSNSSFLRTQSSSATPAQHHDPSGGGTPATTALAPEPIAAHAGFESSALAARTSPDVGPQSPDPSSTAMVNAQTNPADTAEPVIPAKQRALTPWQCRIASVAYMQRFGTHPLDAGWARAKELFTAFEAAYAGCSETFAETAVVLMLPLLELCQEPRVVFFLHRSLVEHLQRPEGVLHSSAVMRRQCSSFLTLFHKYNDVLFLHFHTEQVDSFSWLPFILSTLLVPWLFPHHTSDLFCLWDHYITKDLALHPFVVLVILQEFSDILLEMDREEIQLFLRGPLPRRTNMTKVLRFAQALKDSAANKGLL